MSTDEKMSQKQKIPVVHLKRFSLVKIFALKIFTTQKPGKLKDQQNGIDDRMVQIAGMDSWNGTPGLVYMDWYTCQKF